MIYIWPSHCYSQGLTTPYRLLWCVHRKYVPMALWVTSKIEHEITNANWVMNEYPLNAKNDNSFSNKVILWINRMYPNSNVAKYEEDSIEIQQTKQCTWLAPTEQPKIFRELVFQDHTIWFTPFTTTCFYFCISVWMINSDKSLIFDFDPLMNWDAVWNKCETDHPTRDSISWHKNN